MDLTVKICGLSTEETLDAALDAGADIVGFVFFPRSPRFIQPGRAADLAKQARRRAKVAALSVDMDDAALRDMVAALKPDWLQLHGKESAERVAAVRQRFGVPVMKAIAVATRTDLAAADAYSGAADMLLLDATPPKDATRPGGNGHAFDWSILAGASLALPYLLSGGLTPDNVAEAIRVTGTGGVDVSSGVETEPGRKDPALIRAFIANARAAVQPRQKVAS